MKRIELQSNVIVFSQNFLIAGLALAIEAFLLSEILSHPAGGGDHTPMLLWKFLAIASMPYFAFFAVCTLATKPSWKHPPQFYMLMLSMAGVIFCFLALRQYGHATPGFLMVGYASQWLVISRCVYLRYRNARKPS